MARPLILAATLVLAGGCFHARSYSSQRTVATWRAMQSSPSPASAATTAPGRDTPAPGEALNAEQTYALALTSSPDLAVLEARTEVAEAQVKAARQLDNPQLRLTNFNVDDAIADRPSVNVALRVPIPRPGTVRARVQGAQASAAAQESWTEDARRQLRTRIYKLFARLAMLTADLDHATRAAELQRARREHVGARVEQAVATRLDAALAEVAQAEARDEAARIRAEIDQVHAELERIVGPGGPHQFRVDPGELQVRDVALDRDALTEQAMAARPELRAAQSRVGQAEADAHVARSKAWPWFDWAQVQYRAWPYSTAASFGFGVALTLPIFSWNRGEIRASKALVRQRELEERARIAGVASEVGEALGRVERTAQRVRELEQNLLPQVEAAAREAEAAAAAGSLDAVKASEIAARMLEARRLHIAAQLAHREAVIDLEAAIGAPLGRR